MLIVLACWRWLLPAAVELSVVRDGRGERDPDAGERECPSHSLPPMRDEGWCP